MEVPHIAEPMEAVHKAQKGTAMADELKTIKFQMMLSETEAGQIDDWGFARKIRSRAEAIRRLCQIGMKANDAVVPLTEATIEALASARALKNNAAASLQALRETNPDLSTELERSFVELLSTVLSVGQEVALFVSKVDKLTTAEDLMAVLEETQKAIKIQVKPSSAG
ncbi:hypothetical protein [Rhizobium sp. P28RR-XV]|uniref:hypothetical protein n=1 Tax=Rhizobium sp. P28RR-XV TaxID=2726737 RepID=UPI001456DB6A|nr:hypothetical protein [Rhizobium sp. P28RR-XV]NLR88639.1 hypothetical protein [Rhizobium sp. P28RR-XV]